MSERIIKNYTNEDYILKDLGNIVIPANGAIDLGGSESKLIELATSDDLLKALSLGTDKFQINSGRDLGFSEGIDMVRKIYRPTDTDPLGRWVIRSDSRRKGHEIIFTGRGDNDNPKGYGTGTWFKWDFSAPDSDPRWLQAPEGWKKQKIEWKFLDGTLLKEGTIYPFDMPKGSYMNFYIVFPAGVPFYKKTSDSNYEVIRTPVVLPVDTIASRWVVDYPLEGSASMGDELNTESAMDNPIPNEAIWVCEMAVPEVEGWQKAHGHWTLEVYRHSAIYWGD